jgi:NRAMP (natural resistance-associated macrophage protein)-like metal ion transporter
MKLRQSRPRLLHVALQRRPQARAVWATLWPMRRRAAALWRRYAVLPAVLSTLGPGIIAANAGNDAGGIATYAAAGASYGYRLLWVLVLITVSLVIVQEMCARMGAVTGKGLSDLIRERLGIHWTAFAMLGLLVANASVAVSEFVGIAAAGDLFGLPRWLIVPLAALLLWSLVVFGSYRSVERLFLGFTLIFFAYPIAAFLARPHWHDVLAGLVVPNLQPDRGYIEMVMALIGTTITPYMQLFVQSSTAEKGLSGDAIRQVQLDNVIGAVLSNVVAFFIIVATGATLFVRGITVETAADAARALEPLAGSVASALFALGLFGACMLAGAVLPLTTAYSLCEAFGFEKGISRRFREAPVFMGIFTGLIVLGAVVALIPGLPIIPVLIAIQVVNGVLSPIVLIAALRLSNDPEVMGNHRNGPVLNGIATVTVLVIIVLTLALLGMTLADLTR